MLHLFLISLFLLTTTSHGRTPSFRIHTDKPFLKKEAIFLSVYYQSDTTFKGPFTLQVFKCDSDKDSILVLGSSIPNQSFKTGLRKIKLDFSKQDSNTFADRKFSEVLKRTGHLAPGYYKTFITVQNGKSTYSNVYLHTVDTLLDTNSPVRKDINKTLKGKQKILQINAPVVANGKSNSAGRSFMRSQRKIDKAAKKSGLTTIPNERDGKNYVDLFYEDYFAGRYEVKSKGSLTAQVKQMEDAAAAKDPRAAISSNLGDPSLFSQFRSFNTKKNDRKELRGNISLTTNMANDQEPNSGLSNNYYEIRGGVELPILNLPVEVEGLYTSQDQGRDIKSSYVRVHYSPQKLKDELLRSISAYNSKVSEQSSKSGAIEKIYGSTISGLETEKKKLENDVNDSGSVSVKSSYGANDTRKKIAEIDKKIDRYKTLLAQYENTKYFDSAAVFSKTNNIPDTRDLSYKQLAKLGTDLLPDGKSKKLITGITSFDAGMFPKNDSKYTMAGQMMKGASVSYDLGFCETSATVGKTEFIGRTGTLDRYTSYSSKTTFRTFKKQKAGLIYYGYTADKTLYSRDVFFDKIDITAPGFYNTVHIFSINYAGSISKYITFESEAASSYRKLDGDMFSRLPPKEKMAYHFATEGSVPKTYLNMSLEYDKTGKEFENSTLPMSLAGTEQLKVTARNEFFKSRLSAGIEFNKLIQNNLSSSASNVKWGFDVKTTFKRYPNVAVSYKPYTTFQSHTDTLSIPQRPMFGSVRVAKATYQLRKKATTWRFMAMYNQCQTVMDTAAYGNSTTQANIIYTAKKITGTLGLGYINITGATATLSQGPSGQTNFVNINATYALNATMNLNGGSDIGFAPFGLCRRSVNAGVCIRPQKAPFSFRVISRSNTFQLNELSGWKSVYGGSIDITYKFKATLKQ